MLRENKIKQLSQDEVKRALEQAGLPNYFIQYVLTGNCQEQDRSKLKLLLYLMDEIIPLSHRLKILLGFFDNPKCKEFIEMYSDLLNHEALDELKRLLHPTDYNNLFVELDRICLIQFILNHRDTYAIIDELINRYNTFIRGKHSWRYTIDELKISNSILLNPGQEQQQISINDSIKGFIKNQQKELDEVFELLKIFSDENEKVLRKDLHQQLDKVPLVKEEFKVRFHHPYDYYHTNSTLRKGDKTRIKQWVYAVMSKYFPSLPITAKELRDSEGRSNVTDADFKAFMKSKTDLWFKSKK
jgi:hypothetical protein